MQKFSIWEWIGLVLTIGGMLLTVSFMAWHAYLGLCNWWFMRDDWKDALWQAIIILGKVFGIGAYFFWLWYVGIVLARAWQLDDAYFPISTVFGSHFLFAWLWGRIRQKT